MSVHRRFVSPGVSVLLFLATLVTVRGAVAQSTDELVRRAASSRDLQQRLKDLESAAEQSPQRWDVWMALGQARYDAGAYEDAVISFDKVVSLKPDHALAFAHRGEAHRMKGAYQQAAADCTKALELDPQCSYAVDSRGAAYCQLQKLEEALTDLTAAILADPNNIFALEWRQKVHIRRKAWDLAAQDAEKRVELAKDQNAKLDVWISFGDELRDAGACAEAVAAINRALEIKSDSARAFAHRGEAHRIQGDFGRAVADCTKALELDETCDYALASRGTAYQQLGELDQALADLSTAIGLVPGYVFALQRRRDLHVRRKAWSQAALDAERLAELAKDEKGKVEAWMSFAQTLYGAVAYAEAIAAYDKVLTLKPDHALAFAHRGEAYRMQGAYQQAVADCTKALELDPQCTYAIESRGAAYCQLQNLDEALRDLTTAIQAEPNNKFALEWRQKVHVGRKAWGMAAQDAEKLVQLAKDEKSKLNVWMSLGDELRRADAYAQAVRAYDRAIEIKADHAIAFAARGEAHRMHRAFDRAIADCSKALKLDPDCTFALRARGAAYWSLRKPEEALRDLSLALQREPENRFARSQRATIYRMTRQWDLGLLDARKLVELAKDDKSKAAGSWAEGEILRLRGLDDQAIERFSTAIQLDAENADAFLNRSMAHASQSHFELAFADCEKGLELASESSWAYHVRGYIHYRHALHLRGRDEVNAGFQEAKRDFRRSLKLDKHRDDAANNLAFLAAIARAQDDFDECIARATEALRYGPEFIHPFVYCERAAARRLKGQYHAAVDDCTQALRRIPHDAFAHAERGAALRELRRLDEAIVDLNRAIELQPDYAWAYYQRAQALLSKYYGVDVEKKADVVSSPIRLPDSEGTYFRMDVAGTEPLSTGPQKEGPQTKSSESRPYITETVLRDERAPRSDPLEQASADFRMLVQMNTYAASAGSGLAECLYEMGRFAEAQEACDRITRRSDCPASVYVTRARTQYALHNVAEGLADARRACERDPALSEPRCLAAIGYLLLGKWLDCRTECEKALAGGASAEATAKLLLSWYAARRHELSPDGDRQVLQDLANDFEPSEDAWPRRIIRALLAQRTLDEFAAELEATGEEHVQRRRLCEACYYFGVSDLGAGRIPEAKQKFQRALAVGRETYVEYMLAEEELQRMGIR